MLTLAALTAGCDGAKDSRGVEVFEDAPVVASDQRTIDALRRTSDRLGAKFVIVRTAQLDPRTLSVEADRASGKLDEDQSWVGSFFFPRSSSAITYFSSDAPRLLQIRYGRSLQQRARLTGLDSGPGYDALQQMRLENGSPDFVGISEHIAQAFTKLHLPFYTSWTLQAVTFIDDEFLPLLAVPVFELWNGMSSIVAVHIYNGLSGVAHNYYFFAAAIALLIVVPLWAYLPIAARFSTPVQTDDGIVYQANGAPGCLLLIAFVSFLLIAIYPLFGLLILSSHGRAEDLITLQALGVRTRLAAPIEFRWYVVVVLVILTLAARLPAAMKQSDDVSVAKEVAKMLVMTPIAYFVLPAWTVVLATYLAVFGSLGAAVFYVLAGRRPREAPL